MSGSTESGRVLPDHFARGDGMRWDLDRVEGSVLVWQPRQPTLTRNLTGLEHCMVERLDRLRAEVEALKAGDRSAIYADCGACLGGGKATYGPCEWCAENRRTDAARPSDESGASQ